MDHWGGGGKVLGTRQIQTADSRFKLPVHSRTRQAPDHDDRPKSEDELYSGPQPGGGGIFSLLGPITCVGPPPPGAL